MAKPLSGEYKGYWKLKGWAVPGSFIKSLESLVTVYVIKVGYRRDSTSTKSWQNV